VCCDPMTGTVYVSTSDIPANLSAWTWDGAALLPTELWVADIIPKLGGHHNLPLAIVGAHLVVGVAGSSTLHVLSLSERRLVLTHTLEGMQVTGLAGDPCGAALAVCDATSRAVQVIPWPLPGLSVLGAV
jgi:hypothetical protein